MNEIHSSVVIEGKVEFGENNKILPYTYLKGPLKIGSDNIIGPHVSIGTPGADTKNPYYDSSEKAIEIGNSNIIREFVAIQKPAYEEITKIGNQTFIMQGVSISHDVWVDDFAVITANAAIGGLAKIMLGANIGMGASINQRCIVGAYSIVATNAAAIKNIKPFSRYIPNKPVTINSYALKKFGLLPFEGEIRDYLFNSIKPQSSTIKQLIESYQNLFYPELKREY